MAGSAIARFDAARRALAKAKNVNDVKKVLATADALLAAARRASNRAAQIDFAEFRIRAMRRLGEMMHAQKRSVGLSKGGRPAKTGSKSDPVSKPITLSEAGIGKHLADDARRWAAMPEAEFETFLAKWRRELEVANKRITVSLTQPWMKPKQLPLLDRSQLHLSGCGRKFERVREENAYCPDWLKLPEISDRLIEVIAEGIRNLEMLARGIGKVRGMNQFEKEFNRMERQATELVQRYRQIKALIARLQSAGRSVEPEPEPEYDPELEVRGLWPPTRHNVPF